MRPIGQRRMGIQMMLLIAQRFGWTMETVGDLTLLQLSALELENRSR